MPLFATRPTVLPEISVSPLLFRFVTANSLGRVNVRSRRPLCLVFTKADKVSRGKLDASIAKALRDITVRNDTGVVPFSSVTGQGKRELWAWIETALKL